MKMPFLGPQFRTRYQLNCDGGEFRNSPNNLKAVQRHKGMHQMLHTRLTIYINRKTKLYSLININRKMLKGATGEKETRDNLGCHPKTLILN